jgi:hypothetical protein
MPDPVPSVERLGVDAVELLEILGKAKDRARRDEAIIRTYAQSAIPRQWSRPKQGCIVRPSVKTFGRVKG